MADPLSVQAAELQEGGRSLAKDRFGPGLRAGPTLSEPHRPAGVKVLFRVGLTLVRLALGTTEQRLACPGLLETLCALRSIPPAQLQEEVFRPQVGAPCAPPAVAQQPPAQLGKLRPGGVVTVSTGLHSCPLSSREGGNPRPQVPFSLPLCLSGPQLSATSWGCVLPALRGSQHFLPSPRLSINCSPQVHGVALSEQDLQREIKAQLAQLPASASEPPPRPQARLPGAPAIFEAQQLAGTRGSPRPEVPRIVVQPPEEPRPPRRKPQTRGKTFHGLLTRSRGPPIESPARSHRSSTSFLDTRF